MEQLPPALAAQLSIRENAESMRDALSELSSWETSMKAKEQARRPRAAQAAPAPPRVRAGGGVVTAKAASSKRESAASHTYDVGYQKWDNFDVDKALQAADVSEAPPSAPQAARSTWSPADLVSRSAEPAPAAPVPRPRPRKDRGDAAEEQRQEGNSLYGEGDFSGAIKCYTRAIALNGNGVLAFSNRCQAFLKLKEWRRAESDATIALRIDPRHAKSYLRRAAARSGQGKYRAALLDILEAKRLVGAAEPTGKANQKLSMRSILAEERSIRESLKACVRRAPRVQVDVRQANPSLEVGAPSEAQQVSPEMPE
eukprot:scaffold570_cov234-Pinguiococcus_pyrenoidosus.AAC.1